MKKNIIVLTVILALIALIGGFLLIENQKYKKDLEQLPNQEEVCGTGGGCAVSTDIEFGYQTGMYIPNITLTDFEGNEYKLYDLMEGKDWFVIQFGVEWCGDCERDNEKLATYYEDLPDEIGVVSVYVDYSKEGNPDAQASFEGAQANAQRYPWQAFYDYDNKLAEEFHVVNTPTTVIIQGNGKIKAVTSEMDMDKMLLPNTETVVYPVPTQESYDAAN